MSGRGDGELVSRHRRSIARRVFAVVMGVAGVVAIVVTVASSLVYQSSLVQDAHEMLQRECEMLSSAMDADADEVAFLEGLDLNGFRVTLVAPDGTVLYDNVADSSTMENHAKRPEIADALSEGEGTTERASDTVGKTTIYHAIRLASGDVLRLATDRDAVGGVLLRDLGVIAVVLVVLALLLGLASQRVADRLVAPIAAIDLNERVEAPYEELAPMVERLNDQRDQLLRRVDELRDLDEMRREFTANVTHELKTPIASIQGAAELIAGGIVRPEDVQGFARRIYDDAQRLSALVSDILMLSRLDGSEREGDHGTFGENEPCDLLGVARDVCERLATEAAEDEVSLDVLGAHEVIMGNPRLLDELMHNLCENAVRYNREEGRVVVTVGETGGRPYITVSDTGIGIPQEEQAKVFERFYRVDKGRSRETGGTGLGLAIVKHAAAFHGATIELQSEVGEGTTVTVRFPEGSCVRQKGSASY